MATEPQVYLNGRFVGQSQAKISVEDRGFLFADSVYEATPAYDGRFLEPERHLARLQRGLDGLRIDYRAEDLAGIQQSLLERNGMAEAPFAMVYAQVTRGAAPRGHAFPMPAVAPTVYAFARALTPLTDAAWEAGGTAVTVVDERWGRADLKTTMLLANVLAQQAAADAGVTDSIFVRDGCVLEGSHSNLCIVVDGRLVTAALDHRLLPGITRGIVLEVAQALAVPIEERDISLPELYAADEVFLCGTTTELKPILRIDDRSIGDGRTGPVTRRLRAAYLERARGGGAATPAAAVR